jgi:putative transposase
MTKINDKKLFKKLLSEFVLEDDPLYEMLQWMTQALIKVESEAKVGAEKGKHSEKRKTSFSGNRLRRFDTRMGTMYLVIPKVRKGGYIPFFVTDKKRSEQALMSMVREAFVNGVSTRKIERLAKSLGIENMSAGQVSEINKGLDEQVAQFRERKLDKTYPFIWVDALYEKVRENGRVISMAILVVYGVNVKGEREVLAVEPMYEESTETWSQLFVKLKNRGLKEVCLVISDAHAGIQKAVSQELLGTSWQRCKVHFMRNIMAHVTHKEKAKFAGQLKLIWTQPDQESARNYAKQFMLEYEKRFPDAVAILESGLDDSIMFYDYPLIDKRKISSTNVLERLNKEIRRRSRVVGIFPSRKSYIRLITSYIIEYAEDWEVERSYIKSSALDEVVRLFKEQFKQLLETAA